MIIAKKNHVRTLLPSILILCLSSATQAAVVLTLENNFIPDTTGNRYSLQNGTYGGGVFSPTFAANNTQFSTDKEYRMIAPNDGNVGGGGEKSLVGTGETFATPCAFPCTDPDFGSNTDTVTWGFSNNATLDSIGGSDMTPGATRDPFAPDGVTGLFRNTSFKGADWGFYQQQAGNLTIDLSNQSISVSWLDGITAQWGDTFFAMGGNAPENECNTDGQGCGFSLSGELTNIQTDTSGNTTFDFVLFGEHRITPWEDIEAGTDPYGNGSGVGFTGWVTQFELSGSGFISTVPIPAAVWLFGSGLIGLIGLTRRKK